MRKFFWTMVFLVSLIVGLPSAVAWDRCKFSASGDLNDHIERAQKILKRTACHDNFDNYFDKLLDVAQGYPSPDNKKTFSDFLIWASEYGAITRREAEDYYNRYFSTKFLVLMGEYNPCSSVCRSQRDFELNIEKELGDKEIGLLRVCRDQAGFAKANQLFSDAVVVMSATCQACAAAR